MWFEYMHHVWLCVHVGMNTCAHVFFIKTDKAASEMHRGEEKFCFGGERVGKIKPNYFFNNLSRSKKKICSGDWCVWLPSQGEIPLLKAAQPMQQSDAVLWVIISLASSQKKKYNRVASANFKSKKPIPKMSGQAVVLCLWRSKGKVFSCCARVSHGSGAGWGQCQGLPQTYCPSRGSQCPMALTFAYI